MINAIVYESQTGSTARYAEQLGARLRLPAVARKDAECQITAGASVIYLGWLCVGSVKGYAKAAKRFNIRAVCAVGMAAPSVNQMDKWAAKKALGNAPVFYLQGGFSMEKQRGIYKLMMRAMKRMVTKSLEKKQSRLPDEDVMLDMMKNGGDCVSDAQLNPVCDWADAQLG